LGWRWGWGKEEEIVCGACQVEPSLQTATCGRTTIYDVAADRRMLFAVVVDDDDDFKDATTKATATTTTIATTTK